MTNQRELLSKEQKLMYDIIFSDIEEYEINILEYIDEIGKIEDFCTRILSNLTEAGIKIKEQILILLKDKQLFVLKVKR